MSDTRLPVTFLVGFLGSGKTTLLNRLLTEAGDEPIAVVVNEFGDAGIDGSLVVGGQEELIELDGGCLCCTVRGDLSRTLRDLARRRRRRFGRRLRFERVVVEASGLASPGPAVQTLVLDEELARQFRVDGVVALASLPVVADQVQRFPEAGEQLAYADLVVETHGDRATAEQAAEARAVLDRVTPGAARARALRGVLEQGSVFGLDPSAEQLAARVEAHGGTGCEGEDHDHAPGEPCSAVRHGTGLMSVSLRADRPLRREALEMWLRFLGQSRRSELLRAKGRVLLAGEPQGVVLQGVHQWLELSPDPGPLPAKSVLVLIGRDLDPAELDRGWAALQA